MRGGFDVGLSEAYPSPRHDLAPIRPRIDMAVTTRLVAKLPNIDLQEFDCGNTERQESMIGKRLCKTKLPLALRQNAKLFGRLRQRTCTAKQCKFSH